jgi:hypothetical protein
MSNTIGSSSIKSGGKTTREPVMSFENVVAL